MVSDESLVDTNLDDLLRTAMTIAERGGLEKDEVYGWYNEIVLGELSVKKFLDRIQVRLKDHALSVLLLELRRQLPVEPTPLRFQETRPSEKASPVPAPLPQQVP